MIALCKAIGSAPIVNTFISALLCVCLFQPAPADAQSQLELIATTSLAPDSAGAEQLFGGISGLTWDASTDTWLAVSDDRRSPRVYRLRIRLEKNNSDDEDASTLSVRIVETIPLVCKAHDAESIAPAPDGGWFVGFESPPTIFHFKKDFSAPVELTAARSTAGHLQKNKSWEAIALMPSKPAQLLAISELGLAPTKEDPKLFRKTVAIVLDSKTGKRIAQGVHRIPPPPGIGVTGVAELEPFAAGRFLLLRRSRTIRKGYDAAIDIVAMKVNGDNLAFTTTRLGSLHALGVNNPGNIEAMALGPKLRDGSRLLLLMSDDNFGADGQSRTQLIALRYTPAP
jgi:3-phytase